MLRSSTLLAVATAALLGCTPKDAPSDSTHASASAAMTAPPSASAASSAAPSASADPPTTASATPTATATASGASSASTPAASASAAPNCGTKPLPDCPLQGWMKANMNPAVGASDTAALAIALDKAAAYAPAGYTNWASIAKDGAKAAKGGDLAAAKASCRTCHDQYKVKYKTEMRARKI